MIYNKCCKHLYIFIFLVNFAEYLEILTICWIINLFMCFILIIIVIHTNLIHKESCVVPKIPDKFGTLPNAVPGGMGCSLVRRPFNFLGFVSSLCRSRKGLGPSLLILKKTIRFYAVYLCSIP